MLKAIKIDLCNCVWYQNIRLKFSLFTTVNFIFRFLFDCFPSSALFYFYNNCCPSAIFLFLANFFNFLCIDIFFMIAALFLRNCLILSQSLLGNFLQTFVCFQSFQHMQIQTRPTIACAIAIDSENFIQTARYPVQTRSRKSLDHLISYSGEQSL